ncbi:MAG: hypothetical protein WCR52_09145 [Bacteroidota bacterium]|uniref:hypothetical protein n=1 Tax=Runella sp. TaxID=1960881 RepID=UPI003019DE35
MRKVISILIATVIVLASPYFMGCQSPAEKVDKAETKVQDAKQNLGDVQKAAALEAQKTANAEAWKTFKTESEETIRQNENRIVELRLKTKKNGKIINAMLETKIAAIEQKNKDMKTRIDNYDKSQSDWESFKREFSHDMDGLGQAFKDLAVDNKK